MYLFDEPLTTDMLVAGWTIGWVENPCGLECMRPVVPPPVTVHFGPIAPKCWNSQSGCVIPRRQPVGWTRLGAQRKTVPSMHGWAVRKLRRPAPVHIE